MYPEPVVDLLAAHAPLLRRIARRFSICDDDADDALQRASLILLLKAPTLEPNRLMAWMSVVVKHEALGVRRNRERLVGGAEDKLSGLASDSPGPAERAERRERVADVKRRLAQLKANERLAILLQAQGYSYAEICARCDWTYTKVNRCLAEGQAALRSRRE